MIARRSVWSNPEVVALAQRFVPAADEVSRLQRGKDAEARLFQSISEMGHYGGRTVPTNTRQGTYALTAGGEFLASINHNDPARMADMLRRALAAWDALPTERRRMADDPDPLAASSARMERFYPEDGLALRVYARDLPREKIPADWRANAWNTDTFWLRKDEVESMAPPEPKTGASYTLPRFFVERLARLSFVDSVRGQTMPYEAADLQKAEIRARVAQVRNGVATLRLEGSTLATAKGRWAVEGFRDMNSPADQTRGMDLKVLGRAEFDLKGKRFARLELVAAGLRWGATQYNGRADDRDPAPIGFVVEPAGKDRADRVAPAFIWMYGWR